MSETKRMSETIQERSDMPMWLSHTPHTKIHTGVTVPPKIFVSDVHCSAVTPNECAHARFIWAL